MDDNEKLIRQCQKRSKKAFDELYKTYSPIIFGICLRYTRNKTEAEDLLQNCFLKILNKIDDYEFKGSFEGWIKRLTINAAINFFHEKRRSLVEPVDSYEPQSNNFDYDVVSQMSAKEIMEVVNELSIGYKTVFNLYVIEGYKHTEIAEMLQISEATSRSRLKRAREILQELIKKRLNGEI